jgi:hypothetical protein
MVIKARNGRNSQLWYFDQRSKTIKSVYQKGWSWDIHGHGRNRHMQAYNTNSHWWQMFKWNEKDGAFENIKDKRRLDVTGGKDREMTRVQVWKRNNSAAQKWKLVYSEDAKDIQKEGFAKDYGFKIGKPFYIQSSFPMKRVVTCHGAHHLRANKIHRNRSQKSQHWTYDNVSKTI